MFWTRFIELCNENGKSPNAVAAACGVKSSGTVTGWSKGSIPRAPVLHKMADYFHVTVDYLLGNVNDPSFHLDNARILREINSYGDDLEEEVPSFFVTAHEQENIEKMRSLDVYGLETVELILDREYKRCIEQEEKKTKMEAATEITGTIIDLNKILPFRCSQQPASAGTGVFLGPEEFETIYVQKNDLTRRASFGVPVSGDSMEPNYHDGDVLLVELAVDIRIGQVGVFTINGEGYVKERGEGELISLNQAYDPIPMNESIHCNGRVIGILEPDWIVEK